MGLEESDVRSIANDLSTIMTQDGWNKNEKIGEKLQETLGRLTTLKVDKDLLLRTQIGAVVRKLKKHDDHIVKSYSKNLTSKWRKDIGMDDIKDKSLKANRTVPLIQYQLEHSESQPSIMKFGSKEESAQDERFQGARKRLKERYDEDKARKKSRNIRVLENPITQKVTKRSSNWSTVASRSTVAYGRTKSLTTTMQPQSNSMSTTNPADVTIQLQKLHRANGNPKTSVIRGETREEKHARRMAIYEAKKQGTTITPSRSTSSAIPHRYTRITPASRSASAPSLPKQRNTASGAPVKPLTAHQAMLNQKYKRVCGISPADSSKGLRKPTSTSKSKKGKELVLNTEGKREVQGWLAKIDMGEYAPTFFDNGFDTMQLLSNMEVSDLQSLVLKVGHRRAIEKALMDLKRSVQQPARKRMGSMPPPKRRRDAMLDSDEESNDSFVVSDDSEEGYRPGRIAAMFKKNNKHRSHGYAHHDDYDNDSSDMEATFDEIQEEERETSRYGAYVDHREDLRNKGLLKKKPRVK